MDYPTRQELLDTEYQEAYLSWVESMDEHELQSIAGIDPALVDPHVEKPSYSPDYSFLNDVEEDLSQKPFLTGEIFDSESQDVSDPAALEERVLLREAVISTIINLEASDDVGFGIGVACVALGIENQSNRPMKFVIAERYGKAVDLVEQMAGFFLEDTNISNIKDKEAIRRLVHQLAQTGNPSLSLDVLKVATRIGSCGESQSDVARRHGVSRQAVHKRRKRLVGALGLRR